VRHLTITRQGVTAQASITAHRQESTRLIWRTSRKAARNGPPQLDLSDFGALGYAGRLRRHLPEGEPPCKPYALLTAAASIALVTPIVAGAGPVSAAVTPSVFIGGCRAQGDFATCVAGGNVNHPHSITVHVIARPGQRVTGSWSMTCGKGSGAGGPSGNLGGWASRRNPLSHKLRMPYRRPDSCSVAADAQLNHGGSLHVWLTAVR
jgi:hypothetical protein